MPHTGSVAAGVLVRESERERGGVLSIPQWYAGMEGMAACGPAGGPGRKPRSWPCLRPPQPQPFAPPLVGAYLFAQCLIPSTDGGRSKKSRDDSPKKLRDE